MTALAETMPRKEFESYCEHINEVRGVAGQPQRDDYIGPENFYPKEDTMAHMLHDSMDRIRKGDATTRDYARVVAIRELQAQNRTSVSRRQLRKMTDQMLANAEFKEFMETKQKPEIAQTLQHPGRVLQKKVPGM